MQLMLSCGQPCLTTRQPSGQDELALRKGDRVEVLSRDAAISGDEGCGRARWVAVRHLSVQL